MTFIDCSVDNDYEIFTEFPYHIRKKSNNYIIKEWIHHTGYVNVKLNGVIYQKHRIVATQFLLNDEPLIKSEVDHINHDKTDYHLSNLRWCSAKQNCLNRTSTRGVKYQYVEDDEIPDDLIEVRNYGKHEFEDYYYSPETNLFYFDNGVKTRILNINYKDGLAFVYAKNTERKTTIIYYNKFKRLYDLI